MADRQTYRDKARCPHGHKWVAIRLKKSAGKVVATYCHRCNKSYKLLAGARNDIKQGGSDGR